ncbi:hypothetical protein D3C79_800390 [compost metagenome]
MNWIKTDSHQGFQLKLSVAKTALSGQLIDDCSPRERLLVTACHLCTGGYLFRLGAGRRQQQPSPPLITTTALTLSAAHVVQRHTQLRVEHGIATTKETAFATTRLDIPSGVDDFHCRHHRCRLVYWLIYRHRHSRAGYSYLLCNDRPAGAAGDAYAR